MSMALTFLFPAQATLEVTISLMLVQYELELAVKSGEAAHSVRCKGELV